MGNPLVFPANLECCSLAFVAKPVTDQSSISIMKNQKKKEKWVQLQC
jgi:hypothetical protein